MLKRLIIKNYKTRNSEPVTRNGFYIFPQKSLEFQYVVEIPGRNKESNSMNTDFPYFLSVIIPVYNEEVKITDTLRTVWEYFKDKTFSYQIIVVDDGSDDCTLDRVREFFNNSSLEDYTILNLEQNQGKGYAIREGMLKAQGEYALFFDADLSTPIDEFDKFLELINPEADIIIGSRKMRGTFAVDAPFYRKILGKGYSLLASFMLNLRVLDVTCGFKCYKRKTIKPIFTKQLIRRWGFDAEDLFLARKLGFKIKEVPLRWSHSKDSKVRVVRDIIKSVWELLKVRINDLRGRYS